MKINLQTHRKKTERLKQTRANEFSEKRNMPQGLHLWVGLIMTLLAAPFTNALGGKTLFFAGSESVMTKKNTERTEDQTLFLQPLLKEDAPSLTSQLLLRPNRAEAKRNDLFDKKDDVDDFVSAVMTCRDVPGLSIAVVKDGKSWTKGFGVKDVVKKTPVDASTLFGIGPSPRLCWLWLWRRGT